MSTADSADTVVIERTLAAPPSVVWDMWTQPAHFASWYGPDGASVTVAKMDVRVGGARLVCMEMTTPQGPMQMWFGGEHREVVPGERLVYTESMTDAVGEPLPASQLPPGHPGVTEVIVEMESVADGTHLTVSHLGVPADSPGAAGWNMALDKLAVAVE